MRFVKTNGAGNRLPECIPDFGHFNRDKRFTIGFGQRIRLCGLGTD